MPSEIWHDNAGSWWAKKRSTLGAAVVFTSPGIPMIFQGQEFLEDGWFEDSNPLDWEKLETFSGIYLLYATLFKLLCHGLYRTLFGGVGGDPRTESR